MTQFSSLNVTVSAGKKVFDRPLRIVVAGPHAGKFAVLRHGSATLVTATGPNTANADLSAPRIPAEQTRVAKLADLGIATKAQRAEPKAPAVASDLPSLEAKYADILAVRGAAWLRNMAAHTKDPVKSAAMSAVLARSGDAKPARKGKAKTQAQPQADAQMAAFAAVAQALGIDLNALLALRKA